MTAGGHDALPTESSGEPQRRLVRYLAWVFALSVPFWLLGTLATPMGLPVNWVSALSVLSPGFVALVMTRKHEGSGAVIALVGRSLSVRGIAGVWWAASTLAMPVSFLLTYLAMRAVGLSVPPALADVPWAHVPLLTGVLWLMAAAEEIGWSGYALSPLLRRWGSLPGALLLGGVWAAWHIVPLIQAHRGWGWIAWWTVWTVSQRVVMVWVWARSGQRLAMAILFHAVSNLSFALFPSRGSHWDPAVAAPITLAMALVTVAAWGGPRFRKQD